MERQNITDLLAFLAIAKERSFTKAAAKLGGFTVGAEPHDARAGGAARAAAADANHAQRGADRGGRAHPAQRRPEVRGDRCRAGCIERIPRQADRNIRLTTGEHAAETILWPAVAKLLPDYPDIQVEIIVDYGLTDIVAERYDAGVRFGEQVAKDMIAVRIGPDLRMAVVAAPSYFARHPKPKTPQDLTAHGCIDIRMPTSGGLYAWEFEKRGRDVKVRVDGPLVFNNIALRRAAVLAGFGLSYLPEDQVQPYLRDGTLIRVLEDWCPPFSGYHLYKMG